MSPPPDPHSGPKPPLYDSSGGVATEVARYGFEGAILRFGVVSAKTAYTTHDTGTVTINGIRMPYLVESSPQIGDWVAWIDGEDVRLCIGEYGYDKARFSLYLNSSVSLAANTLASPGTILFDGSSATEEQSNFDHSTSFLPGVVAVKKLGWYMVGGSIEFGAGNGVRYAILKVNGSGVTFDEEFTTNLLLNTRCHFNIPLKLAPGDTLELAYVHTNSGGNIDAIGGRGSTYLYAHRLSSDG